MFTALRVLVFFILVALPSPVAEAETPEQLSKSLCDAFQLTLRELCVHEWGLLWYGGDLISADYARLNGRIAPAFSQSLWQSAIREFTPDGRFSYWQENYSQKIPRR